MSSTDEIERIFKKYDSNNDNQLTLDEFTKAILEYMESNVGQTKFHFKFVDVDGNGGIDIEEFARFVDIAEGTETPDLNEAAMQSLFRALDRDGNGSLDKKEVRKAMKAWGTPEISSEEFDKVFADLDTDGNGDISFAEFAKLLTFF